MRFFIQFLFLCKMLLYLFLGVFLKKPSVLSKKNAEYLFFGTIFAELYKKQDVNTIKITDLSFLY